MLVALVVDGHCGIVAGLVELAAATVLAFKLLLFLLLQLLQSLGLLNEAVEYRVQLLGGEGCPMEQLVLLLHNVGVLHKSGKRFAAEFYLVVVLVFLAQHRQCLAVVVVGF